MIRIGCLSILLVLGACSKASNDKPVMADKLETYDVAASPEAAAVTTDGGQPAPIAVSIPQMAYAYRYAFRLPGEAITKAQAAHVALCDALGLARCQVLVMESSGGDDQRTTASLKLRVASALARRFGTQLQDAVAKAGGRSLSSSIEAEDVSKDIVDTEARLAQRTLLVQRLTEILRTRKGSVADLVAAERSVADAQQEIDQAKGELTELRGRVAMSTVEISYDAVAPLPGSPSSGLGDAVAQSASAFVIGIGALTRLFIYLAPWALLVGIGIVLWRRFGLPLIRRPTEPIEPAD